MSTVFHLVRHADHGHLGKVLTGRTPGVRLSGTGRAKAAVLARSMTGMRLDALFSSPQTRAKETAEFISAATGCALRVSEGLDEIDFGCWEGMRFDLLETDRGWRHWNAARDSARTPAGDSMAGAAERLCGVMGELHRSFPSGSVCLVSHSDVIKSAVCRYFGRSFQDVHDFEIAPASVTTIAVDGRGGRVVSINGCTCREPEEAVH